MEDLTPSNIWHVAAKLVFKISIFDLGNEYSTEDYSEEDEFQTTALEDILFVTDSPLQITTGNQKSTQTYVDICTYHKLCSQQKISLQAVNIAYTRSCKTGFVPTVSVI